MLMLTASATIFGSAAPLAPCLTDAGGLSVSTKGDGSVIYPSQTGEGVKPCADKHSCIGTVTRECDYNSGNCGQIFREALSSTAKDAWCYANSYPNITFSNARVEPQTVDVNKLCDRFRGCESGKYGSTICFCPSSEVDKCVEQKQAMKYGSTLAAWIAPKGENCKLDEDSVQLAPVAAVEAAPSSCGSTLIWLESGITQESLDHVVANQAALGNTGTVELVTYCDLWENDGLGLPSAHILKALTNGGTLDYQLRVRKGGPPCTNPEVLSKVAGTAIDPEDGSERSITAEEAPDMVCTGNFNPWKSYGVRPNTDGWSNSAPQWCCAGETSPDYSAANTPPSAPRPEPVTCSTPFGIHVPEFYDVGFKYYKKVSYVQSKFKERFGHPWSEQIYPMFRPDASPDGGHDGWNVHDATSFRAQDSTCSIFPTIGLYLAEP